MTDDADDVTRKGPADPADAVLAALLKVPTPSSPAEIAAATGLAEKVVRRTLGRLVAIREAKRAGGDRFTASKHGTRGR